MRFLNLKNLSLIAIFLVFPLFIFFTNKNLFAQNENYDIPQDSIKLYEKDTPAVDGIIVKYKSSVPEDDRRRNFEKLEIGTNRESLNFDNLERIRVPSDRLESLQQELSKSPLVEYAEPDYYFGFYYTPNDTNYKSQWYLGKIQAPMAWDTTRGSENVIIGIVDSGIATTHNDIASKVIKTMGDVKEMHGTHVGCIAGAITGNSLGIAGISPSSKIVSVGARAGKGAVSMSTAIKGIKWAADNGAKVINMSWGGPEGGSSLKSAIDYAWSKDVVLVAAAGNDGKSKKGYPAGYSNVVSVAATDPNDKLASFSTFGSWVTIAAPGVKIFSCVPPNNYKAADGTSMASPVVTGVVALIRSAYPNLKNQQVIDKLCQTADKIKGTGSNFKCGRVNAAKAVSGASPSTNPSPSSPGSNVLLNVKLRFQGINVKSNPQSIKTTLSKNGRSYYNGTVSSVSDGSGLYTINISGTSALVPGSYDLLIKGSSHLQKKFLNVAISGGNTSLDLTKKEIDQLKSGDVTWDNKITIEDVSQVLKYYTNFSVPVIASDTKMEASDVTKDGFITIQDIALISINWSDFTVKGD